MRKEEYQDMKSEMEGSFEQTELEIAVMVQRLRLDELQTMLSEAEEDMAEYQSVIHTVKERIEDQSDKIRRYLVDGKETGFEVIVEHGERFNELQRRQYIVQRALHDKMAQIVGKIIGVDCDFEYIDERGIILRVNGDDIEVIADAQDIVEEVTSDGPSDP